MVPTTRSVHYIGNVVYSLKNVSKSSITLFGTKILCLNFYDRTRLECLISIKCEHKKLIKRFFTCRFDVYIT